MVTVRIAAGGGPAPLPGVVVLDTCVLLSGALRRLILDLARDGLYVPCWSSVIGQEWRRNAARLWQIEADEASRQWQALQTDFPCADLGDVAALKEGLRYSDPKDMHVVAAGRMARLRAPEQSVAVVTRNLRDFDRPELRRLGLSLWDPDRLLAVCWEMRPDLVRAALARLAHDALLAAGEPVALGPLLKRERLFRLNRLSGAADGG